MNAVPLRVALRADASSHLGIGHVKRSLALGQALQEAGATVCLATRALGVDTASLAADASIGHICLRAADAVVPWTEDAAETATALRAWRPDMVVVDHYAFDAHWHRAVGTALAARMAAVDDLGDRDLEVDWLIDHNQASDHRAKYAGRIAPGTRLLCGPRHALLSPAYATAERYAPRPHVESIGIFMGGADGAGLSGSVVEACREVAAFGGDIEVVTTRANPRVAELAATCRRWPRTQLTTDVADLAAFFARHDLQIGAGGGATWERCCIGAPALGLVCADNQRVVIPELARLGVLATIEPTDDLSVASIGQAVAKVLHDPQRRAEMAERARKMVDGLGARRVALSLVAPRLSLRAASPVDAGMLHAWRNSPMTRIMSNDAQEIHWPAHLEWMTRVLADPTRLLLVASAGTIPVGVIRFDLQAGGDSLVSLYLDPALHGLGLGSAMLAAGERHAGQRSRPARFVAMVVEANVGSQRMFRSAGYRQDSQDGRRWTKTTKALSGEPSP